MLERIGNSELVVRTHHIGPLGRDFIPKYLNFSHGIKPWEDSRQKPHEIYAFVRGYVEEVLAMEKMMRTYYRQTVAEYPDEKDDYLYVCDLIGFDDSKYDKVLIGRTSFLMNVITTSARGKDSRFILTDEPDDYCKSCAIGNHCTEELSEKEDKNVVYRKALMSLMNNNIGHVLVKRKMLGINDNEQLFITAELFFNPMFHNIITDLFARIKV